MKIDHVLFESISCGMRSWICEIVDIESKRVWVAERVVGESTEDDNKAKDEAMDEAFEKFHATIMAEL